MELNLPWNTRRSQAMLMRKEWRRIMMEKRSKLRKTGMLRKEIREKIIQRNNLNRTRKRKRRRKKKIRL